MADRKYRTLEDLFTEEGMDYSAEGGSIADEDTDDYTDHLFALVDDDTSLPAVPSATVNPE
jgi:hypothetical protein